MRLMKSLNTKLLLIVVCLVASSGLLIGWWQGEVELHRLEEAHDRRLQRLLFRYRHDVAESFQERGALLAAARQSLLASLDRQPENPLSEDFAQLRDEDGAFRQYQGESGLFIPRGVYPDEQLNRLIHASGRLWLHTEPLLKTKFDAFYFITPEGASRIWPGVIVANHRPDHDVTEEIFFRYADPEHNPERRIRWTPIYYDLYTETWMLSLLAPVYEGDQFRGVLGADLKMSYLFDKLASLDADIATYNAFVFDTEGELILQSGQPGRAAPDDSYDLLNDVSARSPGLDAYINAAISGVLPTGHVHSQEMDGEVYRLSHYRLPTMDWYLSLAYSTELIQDEHGRTMVVIYSNIVGLVIFLTLVLFFSLKLLVTDRIARLARATSRVNAQNWQVKVPETGEDEISNLGHSVNSMLNKINDLFRGLNTNISQLELANLESQKLISAIEHSSSIVVILDRQWALEYANTQFWELSGYDVDSKLTPEEALLLDTDVQGDDFFAGIRSVLQARLQAQVDGVGPLSAPELRTEYRARRKNGEHFWLMQSISAICDLDGAIKHYVCVGQDITDIKQNQERMETLAYYDQLTGLQNRLLFKEQLRGALSMAEREKHHLALMYLDLDHFKRINDTLGHEAGDQLLIEVATRLRRCLREEDCVARLGGDEFAVLLKHVDSAQYCFVVASKIIGALNRPMMLVGQEVVVGTSIGITVAPDDGRDPDGLMKNADLAMYQAKYQGRNSFRFYTPEMNLEVESRLNLERDLRQAIRNNEFELYYQPQIDMRSGEIVSAEALIRWHHPERGLVQPDDFIPVAEDSGLIVPIGRWVIRTACQQAKTIQKSLDQNVKIAINVSARQLNDADFVEDFTSVVREIRLDANCLELEITESTLMADTDVVLDRLNRLRELGVSLAIDDFGTGYSSLSILKRLPVDSLKVDRSFVQDLPDDDEDRAITSLIVAMANSLNYKVVVEGVESAAQLDFLEICGCDFAQGFYFSKPVPASELMRLLFDWDPSAAARKLKI
ncbi:EAL domain-containing protein [Marinimicrobium sp. ABcell2]|uniref:bifunctional diguanylate cyclase/phosphodiesterase n=1 Tax=Marinimicrobium sp. ABcell2 TaxID=3069751 RepID=UPI0027B0A9D0|nr:EAL domain-containing protein [Marinimicrobium sp. ABcell2]MDQ2078023.1 EAL domain-containing protein [Marinimicrobium sp. ABcell2]